MPKSRQPLFFYFMEAAGARVAPIGRLKPPDALPAWVEKAGSSTPPASIVHGNKDTLTPLSGVKRFRDRVIKSGGVCELNVYPGVGHLLTRNLADQEDNFDPDPKFRADGIAQHERFLREQGFIPEK